MRQPSWRRRASTTGIGESAVTEAQALAAVKFLLDLGLDPKGATTFGENALFGPAYRGWNTLLAQLIDLGVDVNAVSKAGVTPWLAAAGQGDRLGGVLYNKEGADLLLKHGADPKLGHPCEAQNKCRAEVKHEHRDAVIDICIAGRGLFHGCGFQTPPQSSDSCRLPRASW